MIEDHFHHYPPDDLAAAVASARKRFGEDELRNALYQSATPACFSNHPEKFAYFVGGKYSREESKVCEDHMQECPRCTFAVLCLLESLNEEVF